MYIPYTDDDVCVLVVGEHKHMNVWARHMMYPNSDTVKYASPNPKSLTQTLAYLLMFRNGI